MNTPISVLLIEDSEDDALLLARELQRGGYHPLIKRVDTVQTMKAALDERTWDIVISDYVMPHFDAMAALKVLKEIDLDLPFIIVSGMITEQIAVASMRAGAHDYLMKGNLERLLPAIEREIKEASRRADLKQAEKLTVRLGRIFDNSLDEIYIFDALSYHFVQLNRGARQSLGYSADQLAHLTVLDVQPEMDEQELAATLQPLLTNQVENLTFQTTQRRADGSTYPVEVSAHYSATETPPVFVTIVKDITERRKAESILRFIAEASMILATNLNYETTFQNIARLAVNYLADLCMIYVLEGGDTIRQVAVAHAIPAMDAQLQNLVSSIELQGEHPVARVLRTQQSEIGYRFAESVGRLPATKNFSEASHSLEGGAYMAVPLTSRGQLLGALLLMITESDREYEGSDLALTEELARRASVALENARLYQEAQHALHVRDQFLSIAAHELKTPITSILGFTQLLHRRVTQADNLPDSERRVIQTISEQAIRLSNMVNTLLDVNRIRSGILTIEQKPFDLCTLVNRITEDTRLMLTRHTIELATTDNALMINGDEMRIEQVVQNLIQNAIKYSPRGGLIEVHLAQNGPHAQLLVVDHGIGIPQNALTNIFKQFFRVTNETTQHVAGFGLGLFVVKEIIVLHGGTIEVESKEGSGSTFRVVLPLHLES